MLKVVHSHCTALKMEEASTTEVVCQGCLALTSSFKSLVPKYQCTRNHIQKDGNLNVIVLD
jgi:hypothetical protein